MSSIQIKITIPILITGLFVVVMFVAATYQSLDYSLYAIFLIPLIIFLFLFSIAIGQRFSEPVKNLLEKASHLSKGNLKSRFSPEGQDELGEMAKMLNKVAEDFEKNHSEVKDLNTKIKLRTKTLEEIITILEQKIKNRTAEFQKVVDELEVYKAQLNLKNTEIANLNNQVVELSSKKTRKK